MSPPPSALLFTAPGCPHCPSVKRHLQRLHAEGRLAALVLADAATEPERAAELGVRSVPWVRIGRFEVTGNQSYGELLRWVEEAESGAGTSLYYGHLLENRGLEQVTSLIRERPGTLLDLLPLMESPDTPMATRIGIGAVFEELAGDGLLDPIAPELIALTRSPEVRIRADASHYLGLTRHRDALGALRPLLDDPHPDVREIAMESIAILEAAAGSDPS
ncbi:MAG: hypothetical protein B0D96_07380 [Candidatus Sedimenticola endophacoides]|uniref:Thioredoxin-like fold domain-containing protein n=1 Tax=Candidatus Sedimenticola endophacoides TaxID=2548426 RepID=A0A6N4E0J1_9GAMM|nr:MAG: hypothetical protein B0D94_02340 [Candidatus Sedimenticola endophacoides]OQX35218.1 MAG: hypothetical protein B0D96_07380 [Candidatus Sedimenticola endophacoides]OQX41218.1 MAG: hypothetical protein B0D89_04915 [Candidatus Sedimenticola endophacoides]OQX47443.1 MAG: hypothetical protein B0D86_00045 [Candidatus Sedimenticola endophacoides]PUD99680.1 MAG: hypothetical protein C3L26_07970 [Candidatus Sedimenticola endophacoides]